MSLDRRQVRELLGAWALDALDPDEAVAVEASLATDPGLAAEARGLRDGVARIAESAGTDPEPGVDDVVRAAIGRRIPGTALDIGADGGADPVTAFHDQVAALETLLDDWDDGNWRRPVAAYPWTTHDLMIHLLAVEQYTASRLAAGRPFGPDAEARDHLGLSDPIVDEWRRRGPDATVAAWAAAAHEVADGLAAADPADRITFHGVDASIRSVTIVRAFELWTHADDLREAVRRPSAPPAAGVLHTMADWSVEALPVADELLRPDAAPWTARIVLTGAGGGTWTIDRSGPDGAQDGAPDVLVVTDVVDYCRLASKRRAPDSLEMVTDGDRALADELLAAAQLFSV